jgi:hypothetical protein
MPRNNHLLLLLFLLFPAVTHAQWAGASLSSTPPFTQEERSANFSPYWTGELVGGYASEGGSQQGSGFFLNGTRHLTPDGGFFMVSAQGGNQQLEGASAAWGGVAFSAGVGLGGWTPFLGLVAQRGDDAYNAMVINVGADIPLSPGLTSRLFLNGVVTSHDGPFSSALGLTDPSAEVDELNADIGLSLRLKLDESLELLGGFEQDGNQTAKVQNLAHTVSQTPDITDTLSFFRGGIAMNFSRHWTVEMTGQLGWDSMPAGTFYSDRLAETITLSQSSTVSFLGGEASLKYRF